MAIAVVSSINYRNYSRNDRDYRLRALSSTPLGVVPLATQLLPMVRFVIPLNSVCVWQFAVRVFPCSVMVQYCPLPVLEFAIQTPPKSPNCDAAGLVRVML
jgi:hypothetical protein